MKKFINRFAFTFKNDWVQIGGKYNWYSFNLLHIYFEYDKMTEGLELLVYFMGIGFFLRYNLPASDKIFEEYEKQVNEAIKEEKTLKEKLEAEAWYQRIDDEFGEDLKGDCEYFIQKLLLEKND